MRHGGQRAVIQHDVCRNPQPLGLRGAPLLQPRRQRFWPLAESETGSATEAFALLFGFFARVRAGLRPPNSSTTPSLSSRSTDAIERISSSVSGQPHLAIALDLSILLILGILNFDQPGAHHRIQQRIKVVTAEPARQIEIALQRSGGLVIHCPQFIGNRLRNLPLHRRGAPEEPQHRSAGVADIADSARACRILYVAKVAHQCGHAALCGGGKAQHLFHLLGAELGLDCVSLLPAWTARRHVAAEVHPRTAVNLQLLQRLVELLLTQLRSGAQLFERLRLFCQGSEKPVAN